MGFFCCLHKIHLPVELILVSVGLYVLHSIYTMYERRNKKTYSKDAPVNLLITGGVQGIGKLLAQQFAKHTPSGSVNIIIIDIAENLAEGCIADIKKFSGSWRFVFLLEKLHVQIYGELANRNGHPRRYPSGLLLPPPWMKIIRGSCLDNCSGRSSQPIQQTEHA